MLGKARTASLKTKFRKTFATYFFPVGNDIRQMMTDWVHYLRIEKLWGLEDPISKGRELPRGPVVISKRPDLTAAAGCYSGVTLTNFFENFTTQRVHILQYNQ